MEGDERDLIIAGAGPGGLMAAKEAATKGLDVLLLERQYEIGTPIRTSGGSFIKDLKALGIKERFYNKIRRAIFVTPNRTIEYSYKEYGWGVLDVRALYQHIAAQAAKRGCEIQLGTEVRSPIMKNGAVKGVKAKKIVGEVDFASKFVIDATGFPAVLARKTGKSPEGKQRYGAGAEYEAYVEHLESDTVIFFVGGRAPTGYGWVFPVSKDKARIGIGITRPDTTASPFKLLDDLISKRHETMKGMGKIQPLEIHAGNIPIEPVPKSFTLDGMIVLGDAAAQANPITGEGIRIAMKAGVLAAEAVETGINNRDYSTKPFERYEKEMSKIMMYNKIGLMIQRKMASFSDDKWDSVADNVLSKLKQLPLEDMMNLLKGEFSKKNLLSIAAKNPKLVADLAISNAGKLR